jgi:hypothetical protein
MLPLCAARVCQPATSSTLPTLHQQPHWQHYASHRQPSNEGTRQRLISISFDTACTICKHPITLALLPPHTPHTKKHTRLCSTQANTLAKPLPGRPWRRRWPSPGWSRPSSRCSTPTPTPTRRLWSSRRWLRCSWCCCPWRPRRRRVVARHHQVTRQEVYGVGAGWWAVVPNSSFNDEVGFRKLAEVRERAEACLNALVVCAGDAPSPCEVGCWRRPAVITCYFDVGAAEPGVTVGV